MFSNKDLYRISKRVYREGILQGQLQSAGSDQARLLEKIDKDKMQRSPDIILKIMSALYIFGLVTIPIFALITIHSTLNSGIDSNWVTFVGSLSVSGFLVMQPVILLIFSIMFSWGIMSGGPYKWIHTLPFGKKDIERIGFFTFLRSINIQLISMSLVLPAGIVVSIVMVLGSEISVLSLVLLIITSLLLSIINLVFSLSLLVIISRKMALIMEDQEINSRKTNIIRIVSMVLYMIVAMGAMYLIQIAIAKIPELYVLQSWSADTTNILNIILSIIPFPFAGGYLLTILAMDFSNVNGFLLGGSILGIILFIFLTYFVFRKALSTLRNITSTELKKYSKKKKEVFVKDIMINTTGPTLAFLKRDFAIITREMSSIMILIMPFMIPLYMLFLPVDDQMIIGPAGLSIEMIILLLYVSMVSVMLVVGLTNIESGGTTITASLPISVRDQVKAKVPHFVGTIPLALIFAILVRIGTPQFTTMISFVLAFLPVIPIIGLASLFFKAFLFGKMKHKIVLEEIKNEKKFVKNILVIVFTFVLMGVFIFASAFGFLSLGIAEVVAAILLYMAFNIMFPKQ
jgi:predicted permease